MKRAATLILACGSGVTSNFDYNIMLLKRSAQMRVLASHHVFPGGKCDDGVDDSTSWLDVIDKTDVSSLVHGSSIGASLRQRAFGALPLEISCRLSAIRETFEETGILVARGIGSNQISQSDLKFWREQVHKNPNEFQRLFREHRIIPDLASLHEWSNWVRDEPQYVSFKMYLFLTEFTR